MCMFFFFNDTATTKIYTLSLHDALPILSNVFMAYVWNPLNQLVPQALPFFFDVAIGDLELHVRVRSEEHTSELQSQSNLVCRLLLEKKKSSNASTAQMRFTTRHSSSQPQ